MSTEPDRYDRPPGGQAAGESQTAADPVAVDSPFADPGVADPAAADPPAADTGVADPAAADPPGAGAGAGLAAGAAGVPVPEPTPVIPVSESSFRQPPGTALPAGESADPGDMAARPEVLAGAAFAGGLVVAMLLRRVLN